MNTLKSPAVRNSIFLFFLFAIAISQVKGQVSWFPLGPYGGDARSFAADPRENSHIYLGTATGWIYESHDGGLDWKRLSQVGKRDDLIIDHILPDPTDMNKIVVGAWTADHPDGGIWISDDAGKSWYAQAEMHGQAVLSLARAPSNSAIMVAGTLRGVFRSTDDGTHWSAISPAGSTEIHEVESIAIDPANPNVIYAGTWHLPWKTTDGGAHWVNIKEGIIDDSDVFSIIVDPGQPRVVYASACSGIYKSVTAAEPNPRDEGKRFDKVQGIPSTARRTRKLTQDPKHPGTVYAGTTEGLYRTLDAGEHWSRLTGPDLIVNDVYVDPVQPDHVLLATDRAGVLASDNAGESFRAANSGFSSRQIVAYTADEHAPAHLYVGIVNDKETGGVFASLDGGITWQAQNAGLGGRDVFALTQGPDGTLFAGTNHGIYEYQGDIWIPSGGVLATHSGGAVRSRTPARPVRAKSRPAAVSPDAAHMDGRVYALLSTPTTLFAGTSDGLERSDDAGQRWSLVRSLGLDEVRFISRAGAVMLAADLRSMYVSVNDAQTWKSVPVPAQLTQVGTIAVDDHGTLWTGGREGLFHSEDMGRTWQQVPNLLISDVDSSYFDQSADRLLVTTAQSTFVFSVTLPGDQVKYWNSGWKLRFARPVGDHLIAATLFDGMVVQPQMVDSAVAAAKPNGQAKVAASDAAASTTSAQSAPKP